MASTEATGGAVADHDTVVIRRRVAASIDRAFHAWTDPASIKRWAAPPTYTVPVVEVDLRVGGTFRQHIVAASGVERRVTGRYLVIEPPRRLVYTWRWEGVHDEGESEVTVEFHDVDGATEVIVSHAMLPSDVSRRNHANGWTGCLSNYEALLSSPPSSPGAAS